MSEAIQERDDNVISSGSFAANSSATICAACDRPGIRGIEIEVSTSMADSSTRGILRRCEFRGRSVIVTEGGVVIDGVVDDLGVDGESKSNMLSRFRGGAWMAKDTCVTCAFARSSLLFFK